MSQEHSKVCCTIPAVISKGYEEKGQWTTVDGMKTYVTGPTSAKHAILYIFDVFGFTPQTLQGADILATSSPNQYLVVMPDWFEGRALSVKDHPPQTEEQKAKIQNFRDNIAALPKVIPRVYSAMNEIKRKYSNMEKWGALGFCWGGKMAALTSQEGTPFAAAVQSSPGRIDPDDAALCTIPMAMLASKDEDKALVEKFGEALKVKKHIEIFDSQIHGWMSARADLEDEKVKSEYERGYKQALDFFNEYL